MKKVGVKILPREEVLDSQGRAVLENLQRSGVELKECRVGKFVELSFETESEEQALDKARGIAESVLHNPLIETYELALL